MCQRLYLIGSRIAVLAELRISLLSGTTEHLSNILLQVL
ncbi:hypothetical protein OKW09_004900 [Pseudomonas rhodesiae]|nr:hypothetical protein [Pseudomonas rhodesiae]MDF9772615.1 hypothetical protein [Pseudomonas rhodesiae]